MTVNSVSIAVLLLRLNCTRKASPGILDATTRKQLLSGPSPTKKRRKSLSKTDQIKETLEQLLKNIGEMRKLIDKYQEKRDELN